GNGGKERRREAPQPLRRGTVEGCLETGELSAGKRVPGLGAAVCPNNLRSIPLKREIDRRKHIPAEGRRRPQRFAVLKAARRQRTQPRRIGAYRRTDAGDCSVEGHYRVRLECFVHDSALLPEAGRRR